MLKQITLVFDMAYIHNALIINFLINWRTTPLSNTQSNIVVIGLSTNTLPKFQLEFVQLHLTRFAIVTGANGTSIMIGMYILFGSSFCILLGLTYTP